MASANTDGSACLVTECVMTEFHTVQYQDISDDLWEQWENCCKSWQAYPFQAPAWARACAENLSADAKKYLFFARDADKYLGFLPYRTEKVVTGRMLPIMQCKPWARFGGAIASQNEDEEFYKQFIDQFHAQIPKWHNLESGLLQDGDRILEAQDQFYAERGLKLRRKEIGMSEIMSESGFEGFLSSLSPKWRYSYRKAVRDHFETGKTSIDHYETFSEDDLRSLKKRVMGIYKESWKTASTDTENNLLLPRIYNRFSDLMDFSARSGGLHVVIATIDGDDAAFSVGLHQNKLYCSYQTAYKEKYKKLGIGRLLHMESFRFVMENGFSTNNLLSDQGFKSHYTNRVARFSYMNVFNNNLPARLAESLAYAKRYLPGAKKPVKGS